MNRRGLTLIEVIIGGVIAGVVFSAGFRLLREGLQMAAKGQSVMKNVQGVSLLMDRIEADLARLVRMDAPTGGTAKPAETLVFQAMVDFRKGRIATETILYRLVNGGVLRQVERVGEEPDLRVYGEGLRMGFAIQRHPATAATVKGDGLWIRLSAIAGQRDQITEASQDRGPFVLTRWFRLSGQEGGWNLPLGASAPAPPGGS